MTVHLSQVAYLRGFEIECSVTRSAIAMDRAAGHLGVIPACVHSRR